jgi:hypothetical protein
MEPPSVQKNLLSLGFDELVAVASKLDYKSLGRLQCVSKQLRQSVGRMVSVILAPLPAQLHEN